MGRGSEPLTASESGVSARGVQRDWNQLATDKFTLLTELMNAHGDRVKQEIVAKAAAEIGESAAEERLSFSGVVRSKQAADGLVFCVSSPVAGIETSPGDHLRAEVMLRVPQLIELARAIESGAPVDSTDWVYGIRFPGDQDTGSAS